MRGIRWRRTILEAPVQGILRKRRVIGDVEVASEVSSRRAKSPDTTAEMTADVAAVVATVVQSIKGFLLTHRSTGGYRHSAIVTHDANKCLYPRLNAA